MILTERESSSTSHERRVGERKNSQEYGSARGLLVAMASLLSSAVPAAAAAPQTRRCRCSRRASAESDCASGGKEGGRASNGRAKHSGHTDMEPHASSVARQRGQQLYESVLERRGNSAMHHHRMQLSGLRVALLT